MMAEGVEGGAAGLCPQVHSALRCIASASSHPGDIRQAQDALSLWEGTRVDDYVVSLAYLVGFSSSSCGGDVVLPAGDDDFIRRHPPPSSASDAATLRLAAILALKAATLRRWKDRGRGGAPTPGWGASPPTLLSECVKTRVRRTLLNLALAGRIEERGWGGGGGDRHRHDDDDDPTSGANRIVVADPVGGMTSRQLELLRDRPLLTNASALLARIARMDLPLKFHDLIPTLVEGVMSSQGAVCRIVQEQQQQQHHPAQQVQHQHNNMMILRTILYNAMNCLEDILSELSTQRLLVDKKYRNSIALMYLRPIVEAGWTPSLICLESSVGDCDGGGGGVVADAPNTKMTVQYATLSSRVVSHMLTSSFAKLLVDETSTVGSSSSLVDYVLTNVHSFLSRWLYRVLGGDGVGTGRRPAPLDECLEELLLVHCDLIVNLQRSHPVEFVRYVDPFLALFHSSLMGSLGIEIAAGSGSADANYVSVPSCSNRFAIVFMTFLANVVGTSDFYNLGSFFSPTLVQSLLRTLLELMSIHISPQNCRNGEDDCDDDNDDRILWQDDPEGFYHYEMQRSSEDDVGCASQNLFLALSGSSHTNQIVLPLLKGLFQNVASQRMAIDIESDVSAGIDAEILLSALPLGPPLTKYGNKSIDPSMDLVLQWDSIFTAVGLAGVMLEDYCVLENSWFESYLGPCLALLLRDESPRQRTKLPILLRRMIWLLSCNAQRVPITPQIVGLLTAALSAESDICVRLTTVLAIETWLPHCENSLTIMPSISSIVEATAPALYRLTDECIDVESRSSCLDLLSNLIAYVDATGGTLSSEILDAIIAPLPSVWDNAVNQNLLLKRNVLTMLSCTATFIGPDQSSMLHPLALPVIDDCFAREENMFLVGDALKVWWVFVRLSKTYDEMLARLFTRAVELSKDLENLMILMRIMEHYIILGGIDFLNEHTTTIQRVLCNVVGEVRPRGTSFIFLVIEALLTTGGPIQGGQLLQSCGVLTTLVNACASSYFKDENSEPDRVIVLYLTALARISVSAPSILTSLIPLKHHSGAIFGEEEMVHLLQMKFQAAGNGAHGLLFQQLWILLLLSFYPPCELESYCNVVLRQSNEIFNQLIYILSNVSPDGTNLLSFAVGYDEDEETVDIGVEMYEALLQEQRTKDHYLTISLHEAVSAKMNALPNELGDEYIEFINTIEGNTLQQLERVLARKI